MANRTNSLLDHVNQEFFRPRGLYCLLMSYNPLGTGKGEAPTSVSADEAQPLSQGQRSTFRRAKQNLRNPVSGMVDGEERLPPEVAPLIYVDGSDSNSAGADPEKKRSAMKRLNNYFDHRAQARYVRKLQCKNKHDPRFPDATSPSFYGGPNATLKL